MARLDMFVVHQPQCRFFKRAARCSKEHTSPLTRDTAAKGAQNPFQLGARTAVPRFGQLFHRGQISPVCWPHPIESLLLWAAIHPFSVTMARDSSKQWV